MTFLTEGKGERNILDGDEFESRRAILQQLADDDERGHIDERYNHADHADDSEDGDDSHIYAPDVEVIY
jgi:hypothetical protein